MAEVQFFLPNTRSFQMRLRRMLPPLRRFFMGRLFLIRLRWLMLIARLSKPIPRNASVTCAEFHLYNLLSLTII